jgi:mono/diheme cytochrome c family protein
MIMRIERWRLCWLLPVCFAAPVLAEDAPGAAAPEGKATFTRICATCHGANAEGVGKAPPIAPLIYDESQIAVIVRSGQGEMPPIARAALSDAELSAIVAYLAQIK